MRVWVTCKQHVLICLFLLVVACVFLLHRRNAFVWKIENSVIVNNLTLPPDHPYFPILRHGSPYRLSAEVLHFLEVSRFRAFPHRYDEVFLELLTEFDRIWRKKWGRDYFIFGGTLLGAIRHANWLPYDDDHDVLVDSKFKRTIHDVFRGTRLSSMETEQGEIKVYFTNDRRTMKLSHARWPIWPFVDIFFYDTVTGSTNFPSMKILHLDEVFQTIQLPFNGVMFPAPRCPHKILHQLYGSALKTCCVDAHNHMTDTNTGAACIECEKLATVFDFVKWRRLNDTHAQQILSTRGRNNDVAWREGRILKLPKC